MASKKLDLTKNVQRIAGKQVQAPKDDRQPTIPYPISTRAGDPELPAQAGMLSERLQEIARQYIGARRRSGEALLDAARWLSEARAEAQYGEWQVFLEATNTSDDTAERLLNIHTQAMQNPQFAESVRTNWIGQSVAALLARPSTPPEVVNEVLASPEPPTVADVQKKIRQARSDAPARPAPNVDLGRAKNPQFADFETAPQDDANRVSARDLLHEIALSFVELTRIAVSLPADAQTARELKSIERSLAAIRREVERRAYKER